MVNVAELAQAYSDAAAAGLLDLNALQLQCLAKISAGGGEVAFTLTAGLNGKSTSQECRMDANELLTVINRAKATPATEPEAEIVSLTYTDFSGLR